MDPLQASPLLRKNDRWRRLRWHSGPQDSSGPQQSPSCESPDADITRRMELAANQKLKIAEAAVKKQAAGGEACLNGIASSDQGGTETKTPTSRSVNCWMNNTIYTRDLEADDSPCPSSNSSSPCVRTSTVMKSLRNVTRHTPTSLAPSAAEGISTCRLEPNWSSPAGPSTGTCQQGPSSPAAAVLQFHDAGGSPNTMLGSSGPQSCTESQLSTYGHENRPPSIPMLKIGGASPFARGKKKITRSPRTRSMSPLGQRSPNLDLSVSLSLFSSDSGSPMHSPSPARGILQPSIDGQLKNSPRKPSPLVKPDSNACASGTVGNSLPSPSFSFGSLSESPILDNEQLLPQCLAGEPPLQAQVDAESCGDVKSPKQPASSPPLPAVTRWVHRSLKNAPEVLSQAAETDSSDMSICTSGCASASFAPKASPAMSESSVCGGRLMFIDKSDMAGMVNEKHICKEPSRDPGRPADRDTAEPNAGPLPIADTSPVLAEVSRNEAEKTPGLIFASPSLSIEKALANRCELDVLEARGGHTPLMDSGGSQDTYEDGVECQPMAGKAVASCAESSHELFGLAEDIEEALVQASTMAEAEGAVMGLVRANSGTTDSPKDAVVQVPWSGDVSVRQTKFEAFETVSKMAPALPCSASPTQQPQPQLLPSKIPRAPKSAAEIRSVDLANTKSMANDIDIFLKSIVEASQRTADEIGDADPAASGPDSDSFLTPILGDMGKQETSKARRCIAAPEPAESAANVASDCGGEATFNTQADVLVSDFADAPAEESNISSARAAEVPSEQSDIKCEDTDTNFASQLDTTVDFLKAELSSEECARPSSVQQPQELSNRPRKLRTADTIAVLVTIVAIMSVAIFCMSPQLTQIKEQKSETNLPAMLTSLLDNLHDVFPQNKPKATTVAHDTYQGFPRGSFQSNFGTKLESSATADSSFFQPEELNLIPDIDVTSSSAGTVLEDLFQELESLINYGTILKKADFESLIESRHVKHPDDKERLPCDAAPLQQDKEIGMGPSSRLSMWPKSKFQPENSCVESLWLSGVEFPSCGLQEEFKNVQEISTLGTLSSDHIILSLEEEGSHVQTQGPAKGLLNLLAELNVLIGDGANLNKMWPDQSRENIPIKEQKGNEAQEQSYKEEGVPERNLSSGNGPVITHLSKGTLQNSQAQKSVDPDGGEGCATYDQSIDSDQRNESGCQSTRPQQSFQAGNEIALPDQKGQKASDGDTSGNLRTPRVNVMKELKYWAPGKGFVAKVTGKAFQLVIQGGLAAILTRVLARFPTFGTRSGRSRNVYLL